MAAAGDPLLVCAGSWGRWQCRSATLLSLLKMPIAWFQLSIMVLEAPSRFWCSGYPPQTDHFDACVVPTNSSIFGLDDNTSTVKTMESCSRWEYANEDFTSTIVTEWDLVCDKKHLADVTQFTFMLGVLLGTVLAGAASDRWGRKKPLMCCIGVQALAAAAAALAPWLSLFILCRFVLALATGGILVVSFIIAMEISGDEYRTTVSVLYQLPFTTGLCVMALMAYSFREWRHFHLSLSVISALFLSYAWLVPESPRWLLAVGRDEEVIRLLRRAARANGRETAHVEEVVTKYLLQRKQASDKEETADRSILSLFRYPSLRRKIVIVCVSWFVAGLTFFSFTQSLDRMGSNIFFNVTMAGLVGIPGTLLCIYTIRLGRKRSILMGQFVLMSCAFIIILLPKGASASEWPRLALSGLAITSMSVSFTTLYLFSGEMLPTVVRNTGLGVAAMFSRLGSAVAPFVKSLDHYGENLPMIVIGCSAIVASIGIFFLPETKGLSLPDTFEEGNALDMHEAAIGLQNNYVKVEQKEERVSSP